MGTNETVVQTNVESWEPLPPESVSELLGAVIVVGKVWDEAYRRQDRETDDVAESMLDILCRRMVARIDALKKEAADGNR
jgi:hypothetical protein